MHRKHESRFRENPANPRSACSAFIFLFAFTIFHRSLFVLIFRLYCLSFLFTIENLVRSYLFVYSKRVSVDDLYAGAISGYLFVLSSIKGVVIYLLSLFYSGNKISSCLHRRIFYILLFGNVILIIGFSNFTNFKLFFKANSCPIVMCSGSVMVLPHYIGVK